jgi:succinate dehydrogenase/fumarate reductase flavoprotein subunit
VTVDLLVIGGGMAGLTAGALVAANGGRVTLVERAPDLGGSARFAGFLHTATSSEDLHAADPAGSEVLQRLVVSGYPAAVEWIESLGVRMGTEVKVLQLTRGRQFDTNAYLEACADLIRSSGEILLSATTESLIVDGDEVEGAVVVTGEDAVRRVPAGSTLLASGGFQAASDLLTALIHANAAGMQLRSNPWSDGAGLRLGRSAGARVSGEGGRFYGHLVPTGVTLEDPSQFLTLSFYHSEHGVLFNTAGRRFVDETIGDHGNAVATLEQPEGRALLVTDERVRHQWELASYVEGLPPSPDKFAAAFKRGARCATADSVEEFVHLPPDWGYDGVAIAEGLQEFNSSVPARVDPPRSHDASPLVDPPYYVVDLSPAITFTYRGLEVDGECRVLDAHDRPISGLLAAGADAGGIVTREYAGGLATACATAMRAARTALANAAPA